MEFKQGKDMKWKKGAIGLVIFSIFFVIWKLNVIEDGVNKLEIIKETLELYKEQLHISNQQLIFLENLMQNKRAELPTIFAITPTYSRFTQKAELTRISQTLALVPNVHWIVVEDSETKTNLVRNLIAESRLKATHLNAKTPPFEQLKDKDPRWKKHRGVEQRNRALKWLRDNMKPNHQKGIVYFMDDDNSYSIKLFDEISKVKKVGVWPVGLVGGYNAEAPVVNPSTGKVTKFISGWKVNREFAIDMAGFAINLDLILTKPEATFSYKMEKGFQESEFLKFFTTIDELEPLADNCTKVYVWHTRTEKPKITGIVPGLEV